MFDSKEGGYGCGLLVVIVLVVLFAAFARGGGWGGGDGYRDGGHGGHGGGYGPAYGYSGNVADALGISRAANNVDPAMTALLKDQAVDTGRIIHALDIQTGSVKGEIAAEARRAEERSYRAEIDRKNDELNVARLNNLKLESQILQGQTLAAISSSNCEINRRLDGLECKMLKQPPVFGCASFPAPGCNSERGRDGGGCGEGARPFPFPPAPFYAS